MRENHNIFPFILGAIFLAVGLLVGAALAPKIAAPPYSAPNFRSPFSGKIPEPQEQPMQEKQTAFGVMIENELMARPWQQGLSSADAVYEAPAEGGITRFLAIFLDGKYLGKMGPVRSARSYFLDWAHEWNAPYVHVGGRFDALARLRKEDLVNVDQFVYDSYFRRENVGRTAYEHTVFTSGELLEKFAEDQNLDWKISPRTFDGASINWDVLPKAQNIHIDFGFPTYRVDYSYDEASRTYLRSQAKKPHIDHTSGVQIAPKTLVIQTVRAWSNGDSAGSISMKTSGEGEAKIFYNGRVLQGRWRKEVDVKSTTRFFTMEGQEVALPEKPIWVEVVPDYNSFKFE